MTEDELEEWKALKEAARSYLTNAKKVIEVKITSYLLTSQENHIISLMMAETYIVQVLKHCTWGQNNFEFCLEKIRHLKILFSLL